MASRSDAGGPGIHVTTPTGAAPRLRGAALIFTDRIGKITYVALYAPKGGVYRLTAHRGSPAITEVLEANPLPQPRILAHRIIEKRCSARLSYRLAAVHGDRVLVYAQQVGQRVAVGYLHAGRGTLRVPLTFGVKGHGTLIAYFMRGLYPFRIETKLATFKDAGSIAACRRVRR